MSGQGVRRQIVLCSVIAVANAACWAVITPTFWTPDEPAHMGYVQFLSERGTIPEAADVDPKDVQGAGGEQSLTFASLPFGVQARPSTSPTDSQLLLRGLREEGIVRSRPGQALNATGNPPLYYLLQSGPYHLAGSGTFLDRLLVARLFSALFAGLTVAFVFLFLRQLFPGRPWTWTVGSLALAFQPMLGFMSGAVNNDAMVYAISAAVLWGIARAFRQGLDWKIGLHIGAAMAVGLLTKLTLIGLMPGILVGLVALVARGWTDERRTALTGAAVALASVLVPYQGYLLLRRSYVDGGVALDSGVVSAGSGADVLRQTVSYVWQSVLPALPFMNDDQFPYWPPWETYFKGFIGRFGWAEYVFPPAWYWVALVVFIGIAALAVRGGFLYRSRLWARKLELITYAALAAGIFVAIEVAAARYNLTLSVFFEQTRYLFPVLALYPAVLVVAALGAGPRWGRAVGAFLVVLAMGHSIMAQMLTLARFYG